MGKGSSKRSVQHCTRLADGAIGRWIFGCGRPATRWIDWEQYGIRRWLSTAYRDNHGNEDLRGSSHIYRVRPIAAHRPNGDTSAAD